MATNAAQQKQDGMEKANVSRIATISQEIREAIREALPAPPEQFFHVMVPGKVVNFSDFTDGFDENGEATSILSSTKTELNQAILCDDMPALAPIQLGPTGKSVSRSYAATLSKLVPAGTTVGVEVADANKLTDAEKRYQRAMEWLLTEDRRNEGKTHLESYIEKQKLYAEAERLKIREFDNAYKEITRDPLLKTNSDKRAAYDKWVHENARTLRNSVEGAYKDWVIHGRKEAVEYWFAVVDNESAMSRVEQSKEAMRNSIVTDVDGSVTYPKVSLSPSNWAWICQQKIKAGTDKTRTVEQVTFEILNLQKLQGMIKALQESPPALLNKDGSKPNPGPNEKDDEKATDKLKNASAAYIQASTALDNARRKIGAKTEDIEKARGELKTAKENLDDAYKQYDKDSITRLTEVSLAALDKLFNGDKEDLSRRYSENQETLDRLIAERDVYLKEREGSALKGVVPSEQPKRDGQQDYFIPITVEVSSTSKATSSDQHSLSVAAAAGSSFGLFRAGSTGSVEKASTKAEAQMANSDVKVSFECMRVDITRSWLRPELFYDEDLRAAPGALISPGHVKLAALMDPHSYKGVLPDITAEDRETELQRYNTFPLYPTAFLVACNVVLEISGETSAIQEKFNSSSTTAKGAVTYGPFAAVSNTTSKSDASANSTCETTASGCRITIKSPQIIGWISELVPALPRNGAEAVPASTVDTSAPVTFSTTSPGESGSAPQPAAPQPAPQPAATPADPPAATPAKPTQSSASGRK